LVVVSWKWAERGEWWGPKGGANIWGKVLGAKGATGGVCRAQQNEGAESKRPSHNLLRRR